MRHLASDAPVPASVQQQQLWYIDRVDEQGAANNLAYVWTLRGPLDAAALESALAWVIDRQESLRGRFVSADPVDFHVDERTGRTLPVVDLTEDVDPGATFDAIAERSRGRRFSVTEGPLYEARLIRLAPDEHRLLWIVHHIAWDAGSVGPFLRDLSAAYRRLSGGVEPDSPEPPVTYRDYSRWQRDWLGVKREGLAERWRTRWRGAPVTELPSDLPRPRQQTFGGKALDGELLAPESLDRLRAVCAEHRATSYMVTLGLFAHLLGRWTRSDEVTVGSPFDLRADPRLDDVVGFFVNMVPLRIATEPGSSLVEQIAVARDRVLEAMDDRELPFSDIVAAVNPPRDPGRSPLFQIEFAFETDSARQLEVDFGEVRFEHAKLHDGGSRFDLSLIVRESRDRIGYTVEYNPDLFHERTITALVDAFRTVMTSALAAPGRPLDEHALLAPGEPAELAAYGAGDPVAPTRGTVLDVVRGHAETDPGRVAVRYGGTDLTYGDLVREVRAVAGALAEAGVGSSDRVALLARQSTAAVIGMLATQWLGAAYVPLDVDAPPARLRTIAGRAGVTAWLVGDTGEDEVLARIGGVDGLVLELGAARRRAEPREPAATEADSAYLIFTSGTTGTPKGVDVPHSALAHFCREINEAYRIDGRDRVLGFAKYSFDVSVFEVFATLTAGATLCVPDLDQRRDPALLTGFLRDEAVTVAELPPALMPLLDPDLPELRLVSVGGEAFPGALVATWTQGGREFWNGYGPTETTVAVTLKQCSGEWPVMPPIGRPIRGCHAYVVDERLRPVPPGAVGELLISGPTLARGYFGDQEGTARAFVTRPEGRSYRTGDLVRWRGDGDLDFLGRADRQVKLNGHRIELTEVERVLTDHPEVRRVAVSVCRVPDLGRTMAAFAVLEEPAPKPDEVLRQAAAVLPRYAVPARLVPVGDLPLTANKKVDHEALERLLLEAIAEAPGASEDVRELTETERALGEDVIGPVLARPVPDPDTSFFELGGNSLQATQVVAGIARRFDVQLSIGDFFGTPTIRGLAAMVDGRERRSDVVDHRLRASMLAVEELADQRGTR
nr:amino acid adenylation domain-containing protein [Amycolatopsis umgeniensis]